MYMFESASEQRGNLKYIKDLNLKAKAQIWP